MRSKDEASQEAEEPDVKSPPILFSDTQVLLRKISDLVGHPVISYWNSSDGNVCNDDVVALHTVLESIGKCDRIGLFVKSDGGAGEAALRMVHLIREFTSDLHVYVPLQAASAATMLSLGGNSIFMGPMAHLSAVDTSLRHDLSPLDRDNNRVRVSQDEVGRLLRLWRDSDQSGSGNPFSSIYEHIHPLVIGAVDRVSALSTRICSEILSYHMEDNARIEKISHTLNSGYPSHSYPITMREAERIGLQVKSLGTQLSDLLLDLNHQYSKMGQRASTDIDANNSHDESILNILETSGIQIFFQNQKDWLYRETERRWVALNNSSSWKKVTPGSKEPHVEKMHIS